MPSVVIARAFGGPEVLSVADEPVPEPVQGLGCRFPDGEVMEWAPCPTMS